MKALTFTRLGSYDVLEYSNVDNPILKSSEILVEMKVIGLNYKGPGSYSNGSLTER